MGGIWSRANWTAMSRISFRESGMAGASQTHGPAGKLREALQLHAGSLFVSFAHAAELIQRFGKEIK